MARRKGGFRRRSRGKLQKERTSKGKISLKSFLQPLNVGDKVRLCAESAYQRGMYCLRYHNKIGVVKGKQGTCYNVAIYDHRLEKVLIVHPVHLKKVE